MAADGRSLGGQANAHGQVRVGHRRGVRDAQAEHGLAQLLGHQACPARRGVGQYQDEFLATIARRQVGRPRARAADRLGHLAQGLVTGQVAKAVVVGLEVVHVDHQQRQLLLLTHGPAPFQFQVLVEVAAVGQPGQAIGVHQPLQHQVGIEQLLLADAQGAVGLVALQQGQVGARVVADARHQFDGVRQLDQVVVGPGGKRRALDQRVFLGRQDDDRDVLGRRVVAVLTHQGQPVQARHDQVLQDHRGLDAHGLGHRLVRVGAEVEVDVLFIGQATPHRLADHGLVVDQQHHRRVLVGGRETFDR
ncbi:hypothetical protein D3C80_645260 [compost metagenome]